MNRGVHRADRPASILDAALGEARVGTVAGMER